MKLLTAAFACACALTFAAAASAVDFGANDDTGKYAADGGAAFFSQMRATGLKQNVMTVRWTPGSTAISDRAFLDRGVPAAAAAGIKPVLAVYPYPPSAIESGAANPAEFGAWVRSVADAYADVTTFIVGNEPNLNTFWRAQGDGRGTILSGASFGPFLAAGYDALKGKSSGITVLGVGSSPRGDKAPAAAGKSSPVHFLDSLGDWYRSSRRPAPLMDGFSFHPYPNPSDFSVPFSFAYGWPNAGVRELPRVKQALWDAFDGTAQPTTLQGLELYLDEVGWQVDTNGLGGYEGAENVRVTSEQRQAEIYADMVRFVACDPDVAQLNFFGFYDERNRSGWQSALRRVDGSERASSAAVAAAISAGCTTGMRSWSPLTAPEGAAVEFGAISPKARTGQSIAVRYTPTAGEDVTVKAGFVPASTPRSRIAALLADAGRVDANRRPPRSATARIGPTAQVLAVVLSSAINPARAAVFTSREVKAELATAKAKPKAKVNAKAAVKAKSTGKAKPKLKAEPKRKAARAKKRK